MNFNAVCDIFSSTAGDDSPLLEAVHSYTAMAGKAIRLHIIKTYAGKTSALS
ncbi:MAG: hypothetical protein LBL45_08415 [Treponema sp.]|jgi:hypothetical protein|nr:hypothetical protein [Treponema sp.]